MPDRDLDATIYVKNAPDIRLEDGLVHICHSSGRLHIEFVMRPNSFLRSLRNANKLADEFHTRGGAVGIKDHAAKP